MNRPHWLYWSLSVELQITIFFLAKSVECHSKKMCSHRAVFDKLFFWNFLTSWRRCSVRLFCNKFWRQNNFFFTKMYKTRAPLEVRIYRIRSIYSACLCKKTVNLDLRVYLGVVRAKKMAKLNLHLTKWLQKEWWWFAKMCIALLVLAMEVRICRAKDFRLFENISWKWRQRQ